MDWNVMDWTLLVVSIVIFLGSCALTWILERKRIKATEARIKRAKIETAEDRTILLSLITQLRERPPQDPAIRAKLAADLQLSLSRAPSCMPTAIRDGLAHLILELAPIGLNTMWTRSEHDKC